MSETDIGRMYGFDVPNPPDIYGQGQFVSSPTPPLRATTITKNVSTNAIWDHDSGLTNYWGNHWVHVLKILTLDFHWESIADLSAQAESEHHQVQFTHGNATSDTDTTSFSQSIGAEGGGEGKGLSLKLSASLTKTETHQHNLTISDSITEVLEFNCAAHETIQVWQLIATFTHNESVPPFDTGHSIDTWDPPFHEGTHILKVRTPRWVLNTFPQ